MTTTNQRIIDLLIEAGADPAERANHFEGATPQLDVKSVPATIAYFTEKLGFEKEWEAGSPTNFACVFRDQVFIFLTSQRPAGTGSVTSIAVRDVDGLFEEYKARGAEIVRPPTDRPWGGRVMAVGALDGNILDFYADRERTTDMH